MTYRINANALTLINNLYFLEDRLYSGIAYIRQADSSYKARHVNDGVVGNQYIPFCLQDHTIDVAQLAIYEYDSLESVSYSLALNDKLYQGFLVSFYGNGHVSSEEYYEDGFCASEANWTKLGSLDNAILTYERWTESISFSGSILKSYSLAFLQNRFILYFDEVTQQLTDLNISAVFNEFDFSRSKLFPFNGLDDILNYPFSNQLLLECDYVDDQFIKKLLEHKKIQHVSKLSLIGVALKDFSFLLHLTDLDVLEANLLGHMNNLIDICQHIKLNFNPKFKLILNEKEVIK